MLMFNKKAAVLTAILFSLCFVQLASAAIYYTPAYANVSEDFMLNITVSGPHGSWNISELRVNSYALPPFAINTTSNSSSTSGLGQYFQQIPGTNNFKWSNVSGTGMINATQNQSFTVWMNNSIAGAPSSYRFEACIYNATNASNTRLCTVSDTGFVEVANITIGMNFGFSGYVKNDTGILQPGTNVTIYDYVMNTNGPPSEVPLASATTDSNGLFRLWGINGSNSLYKIKLLYNNSVRATLVGPNLPPFPSGMFYNMPSPPGMENIPMMKKIPVINGTTFYLQPAVTINVSAVGNVPAGNGSSKSVKFGYELIDQLVGFPVESNVRNTVLNKEIVVPMGRSYTVMAVRDPISFLPYSWCFENDKPLMNDTACPTPPTSKALSITNLSVDAGGQGGILNLTLNLTYSMQYLSGCINLDGNTSLVNITRVTTRLVPWEGFIPPFDAKISTFNITNSSDNLVYNDARCNGSGNWNTFYNMSLMGSASGVSYLIEFYARKGATEAESPAGAVDLAGFYNITMNEQPNRRNMTLFPLAGQYVNASTGNTTKIKIFVQNSSGAAITTNMHVEVKVKHSVFGTMHYIIEDISGGVAYLPILNNSNWAKVSVYPNEAPPVEKTLNLNLIQNNITVQVGEFTFRKPLANGSLEFINVSNKNVDESTGVNMTFYRNANGCNTPNPPVSCMLTQMDANNFNPMAVMMAGKVNLELKMKSGTTLYFINFDLLSAKPPTNSIMSNNASSASASSQTQTWEQGSFVPHVYDYAFVILPYNDTVSATLAPDFINESYASFNMSLPYLKDENWGVVWNNSNSTGTPSNLPDEYADFNTGDYAGLLRDGGVTCSTTNTTSACYMNTADSGTMGGYFSLKVPHFSGVGSSIAGIAPAAATATTASSGGTSTGSAGETEVTESRTFTNIAANSENTFRLGKAESVGVNAIVFTTTEDITNVKVEVKKLVAKPSDVGEEPAGELYRYIKIDAPLLEGKLKEAKVQFEVPKSWLESKDVAASDVVLMRFTNNEWRKLTTSILSDESAKAYYEAITPGFSYFAVTAVKEEAAPADEETEEAEEAAVEEEKAPAVPPSSPEGKESSLVRNLLIAVGVLALLLLIALGYKKKSVLVFWREPTDKERQDILRGEFLKRKKQQSWGGGSD